MLTMTTVDRLQTLKRMLDKLVKEPCVCVCVYVRPGHGWTIHE